MVDVDVRTVSDGGLDKLGPCRNTDSEGKYFVGTFFKTLLVAAMSTHVRAETVHNKNVEAINTLRPNQSNFRSRI